MCNMCAKYLFKFSFYDFKKTNCEVDWRIISKGDLNKM